MARPTSAGNGANAAFNKAVAMASNPAGVVPGGVQGFTPAMVQSAYGSGYVATDSFLGPGRLGQGLSTNPNSAEYINQGVISDWEIDSFKTAVDKEALEDLQAEYADRAEYLAAMGLGPDDIASRWYNPKSQDDYLGVEPARAGAGLTDMPTSTTNFKRPRTVAAGWAENEDDYQKGTLTVVFRDGTPYNFYDVPRSVWIKFHNSISKGRPYLNSTFPKEYAHGPADVASLSDSMRDAVYMAARTTQLYYGTNGKGHYQTSYKTKKKPAARDKVVRYNADGSAVVKVRVRTQGSPQNPSKATASPRQPSGGKNPSASAGKNPNQK